MDQLTPAQAKEQLLADLSLELMRQHVEHIALRIPSRAAGSASGRRMADYSCQQLLKAGAQAAQVHEVHALVSFPLHAELRVDAPVQFVIQANTLGHSAATADEGLSGELVYLAAGTRDEFEATDVKGKIVLTELGYAPARHEKQRLARKHGALACVMLNWGPDDSVAVPYGSVKPGWGTPTLDSPAEETQTIPCVGISRASGLALRRLCGARPVKVWLRTHVENAWHPVHVTLGAVCALEGTESDDFVLVGGHQDSWPGPAATDNAAGSACLLELARVFAKHRSRLRRSLKFGFWAAHETGTMAGSTWFADHHWDELREHACAYLQIDQPGCAGTTEWESASSAEMRAMHEPEEAAQLEGVERHWRAIVKNGDASFIGLGLPMMNAQGSFTHAELAASAQASLGWWHHSDACTLDKVDAHWLWCHSKVYAAYLWELCTAPILPFTFSPVAAQLAARLRELEPMGREIDLARLVRRADAVLDLAEKFDALVLDTRARFDSAGCDEAVAARLNATIKRLSRLFNPLLYSTKSRYEHDSYGHTAQAHLLPGLYELSRLEGTRKEDEHAMLLTALSRQRNRVSDGLDDLSVLLMQALKT